MSGDFRGRGQDAGTTPQRRTIVTLDAPQWFGREPNFRIQLHGRDIAPRPGAKGGGFTENVHYVEGIGWRLDSYFSESLPYQHEADIGAARVLVPGVNATGPADVAAGSLIKFHKNNRYDSSLTGVPQGSRSTTADTFIQKTVPSGADWQTAAVDPAMAADQAVHPSPALAEDFVAMDRFLISSENHRPDETIHLRFDVPSQALGAKSCFLTIHFTGMPGFKRGVQGTGKYALKLLANGEAQLYEMDTGGGWELRHSYQWSPRHSVGGFHAMSIIQNSHQSDITGKWSGSKIAFLHDGNFSQIEFANLIDSATRRPNSQIYDVPSNKNKQPQQAPIRIDIRRDMRAEIQITRELHRTTGWIRSRVFSTPILYGIDPDGALPIQVVAYGLLPLTTDFTIKLFTLNQDTNTWSEIASSATANGSGWRKAAFPTSPLESRYCYVEVHFTPSTSQHFSPTLTDLLAYRDSAVQQLTPEPVVAQFVEGISLSGLSRDPSTETASILVADIGGVLDSTKTRAGQPVTIDVRYDPNDATKISRLFQGYLNRARRKRRGTLSQPGYNLVSGRANNAYPKSDWSRIALTCMGEWERAMTRHATRLFNFALDPQFENGNKPYKVTDAIRLLFQDMGYHYSQIYIPDNGTRLFVPTGQDLLIEPESELLWVAINLARDYLGAFLAWEPNSSAHPNPAVCDGMWQLLYPPKPPYNFLAEFYFSPRPDEWTYPATIENSISITDPKAWPSGQGTGAYSTQLIKRTFARYGSLSEWMEKPEANVIYVSGVGRVYDAEQMESESWLSHLLSFPFKMSQSLVNWVSCNFHDGQPIAADPSHPDYLGYPVPLYYSSPGLLTPQAVNFAARRIFDLVAHARFWVQFEAPLILVSDITDLYQRRPRPLRFGDMVKVEGQTFVVNSVNIEYAGAQGGDRFQHAVYELFSPSPLNSAYFTAGIPYDAIADNAGDL